MVQVSEGPCGGAVSGVVAPTPPARVEVVDDLDCWALLLLGQIGGADAVMSAHLGLLRLRQHGPWQPPELASEEVAPSVRCTIHVLAALRRSPLSARKRAKVGRTDCARSVREGATTPRSSA
jgi:hypothetical protein